MFMRTNYLGLILLASLLLTIIMPLKPVQAYSIKGTRVVDGDPSDWIGTPPATTPGYTYSNGEFIVSDPVNDTLPYRRADWDWPIVSDVDIVEFRLTGDNDNMYLLFKFNTMRNEWSYYIMVAIDLTPDNPEDGFNTWLPDYADTELGGTALNGSHVSWQWDYIIAINRDWDDDSNRNNSMIGVYDHSWTFTATGDVAFNSTNKVIEASIPWDSIGGVDSYLGNTIRIWVAVFVNSFGGIWDPYDNSATDPDGNPCLVGSDLYDTPGQTPTTDEVYDDDGDASNDAYPTQDHWLDTSFTVTFSSNIPEPIPETLTVMAAVFVIMGALIAYNVYNVWRRLR